MEFFAYFFALIWSDASRVGHQGKDSQTGM